VATSHASSEADDGIMQAVSHARRRPQVTAHTPHGGNMVSQRLAGRGYACGDSLDSDACSGGARNYG
jgi:hypothetical protein